MIQENQMKTIMAAIQRGDMAALDQLKREFPAGEGAEDFDYVEVDWTLTYDKEERQIEVNWDAKVKLEGGYITTTWCEIKKGGDTIAWRSDLRNNEIKVLKQGDNYGWMGVTYTPAGPETISAQIGGFINAPGSDTKVYMFDKTITIDK